MRRELYALLFVLMIGCISCNQAVNRQPDPQNDADPAKNTPVDVHARIQNLKKLLKQGHYFKFENHYTNCRDQLPVKYRTYFDIIHCELFGYPALLEIKDQLLLEKYYASLTEQEKASYHLVKISHYQKKYDYEHAFAEVLQLETFAEQLDTFLRADIQQWHATYSALQSTPSMTLRKYSNDTIQLEKARGHFYIPVSINGNMIDMVFDTGAGKSLISKSMAERFGLKVFETKTDIIGATGARSATNIGIAETLIIGNTLYEHAVFEVIEDSLLGVPAFKFFFDGLIGLNLLYPLGSITLNAQGALKTGDCSEYPIRNNLAIHLFNNRVPIIFRDDTIPVKFDTGAFTSIFNRHFYELFKKALLENGKQEIKEYGGIGGKKSEYDMIQPDTLKFIVNNDTIILYDTWVHSKFIHEDTVTYYGLLGLDIVDHFQEISMNFTPNSVYFKTRY